MSKVEFVAALVRALARPAVVIVTIRPATASDLDALVELAAAARADQAVHQPVFWRSAADARDRHRPFLAGQIADDHVISLVATDHDTVVGFAIGVLHPAPPVYAPGGPTFTVDDFTVDHPNRRATTGTDLLRAVRTRAATLGAVQIVAVIGDHDHAKQAALAAARLNAASSSGRPRSETRRDTQERPGLVVVVNGPAGSANPTISRRLTASVPNATCIPRIFAAGLHRHRANRFRSHLIWFAHGDVVPTGVEQSEVARAPGTRCQTLLNRPSTAADPIQFARDVVHDQDQLDSHGWPPRGAVVDVCALGGCHDHLVALQQQVAVACLPLIPDTVKTQDVHVEVQGGIEV